MEHNIGTEDSLSDSGARLYIPLNGSHAAVGEVARFFGRVDQRADFGAHFREAANEHGADQSRRASHARNYFRSRVQLLRAKCSDGKCCANKANRGLCYNF